MEKIIHLAFASFYLAVYGIGLVFTGACFYVGWNAMAWMFG